MQTATGIPNIIPAKTGMNSGFASILLQDNRTILIKRANSWSALVTRLKAMYSAFIGKPCSAGNFIKMVGDGE